MWLFDKIKNVFKKEDKSVSTYEKGLSKTRKSFVNKLASLSKEYDEINENYFEPWSRNSKRSKRSIGGKWLLLSV